MIRKPTVAALLFAAVALTLALPGQADATVFRTRGVAYRPVTRPVYNTTTYYHHHMPGWDWWRTYPWSPYNYGRNPYNPIVLPYYYDYPPYPAPPYYPYGTAPATTPPSYSTAGVPPVPKLNLAQPPAPPPIPPIVIGGTRTTR